MDPNKPAIEIRQKDLDKNTAAFLECFRAIRRCRKIERVVDVRYGLGGWSTALLGLKPNAKVLGFEANGDTFAKAEKPKGAKVFNCKFPPVGAERAALAAIQRFQNCDLLLADINALTLKMPTELLRAIEAVKPRAIIMTDIACAKMHINWPHYGLEGPDLDRYFERFNEEILPNWTHVCTARLHFFATSAAWVKG